MVAKHVHTGNLSGEETHLLAVLERENVVALDLVTLLGEVGSVSGVDGIDIDGHLRLVCRERRNEP